MRLARVECTVHVDRMLDSLEPGQFDEWMAYYMIEPWGIEPPLETEEPKQDSLSAMRRMAGV